MPGGTLGSQSPEDRHDASQRQRLRGMAQWSHMHGGKFGTAAVIWALAAVIWAPPRRVGKQSAAGNSSGQHSEFWHLEHHGVSICQVSIHVHLHAEAMARIERVSEPCDAV